VTLRILEFAVLKRSVTSAVGAVSALLLTVSALAQSVPFTHSMLGLSLLVSAGWTPMVDPADGGRTFFWLNDSQGRSSTRVEIDRIPPGWSNARAVVEAVAATKRRLAERHPDAVVADGERYLLPPATQDLPGAQYEAEYTDDGRRAPGRFVVVTDGYGGAVVWSYVSSGPDFDAHREEATDMLRSLIVLPQPVARGMR
jgi:hypothetical protein